MPKAARKPSESSSVYVGIDPGQSGGIAVYMPRVVVVKKMMTTDADIMAYLSGIAQFHDIASCCLENVHSMPGQGVSSTFKFGVGFGGLKMALTALGVPFDLVQPRTWQKALGVTSREKTESQTQFKNRLKAKAQQLMPKVEFTLATCDAALIALYCYRKATGQL